MGNANFIGRVGALAVALGVGIASAPAVAFAEPTNSDTTSSYDRTALLMGGTTIPKWNDSDVEVIMAQFIAPTHPGGMIKPVAVTTPEEGWPITGLIRLIGLALGPPSIFGPGGAAWPDEPGWELSGLFDLTYEQSTRAGVADLEAAMAKYGNDHLVIYGYSQGATIATREKRRLAEQYPGTTGPDIDFVLSGDPNLPNGGLLARFPGLYIPILDLSFDGPEPTNTSFHTDVITRQYDGVADFPLYPLNVISLLNAVLGLAYVHLYPFDVSLADPSTPSPDTHGDTSYYFFETPDLPLFGPLRTLGVPEPLIDVFEPFFRVLVELGYDRSIAPWEPTPARLIPPLNLVTVTIDLVAAIGEGIKNAAALIGSPAPLSIPAAQPTTKQVVPAPETTLSRVSPDGVAPSQSTFVAVQPLATPTPTPTPTLAPKLEPQTSTPAPKLEPLLSLTTSSVAHLSPTTTELRSNPAATTKDNAGTTTTNNSLTTTDLTLSSTLSPAAPSNGPLVRPGNLFTPGSTTPAPTQSGTTNTQSTTGTTTTTTGTITATTTGTKTTTTTGTSTTTDGSTTTDQAGGDADG